VKLNAIVANKPAGNQTDKRVNKSQQKFQPDNVAHILPEQMLVLGNISIVVIGNAQVEHDIQKHRKIQERKVQAIVFVAHDVLHRKVDSENPKRLNQDIQKKQQNQVCYKFALQSADVSVD
jgi:hypothetical protein